MSNIDPDVGDSEDKPPNCPEQPDKIVDLHLLLQKLTDL
tara:strand:- start:663 stop:779 length:117 start_codon:yes stop_codon:yes gene_type:complete